MLYNEFIEGTGCKDNEHNYNVYKNLEIMYMNSDMSKAEIYEYGKKLVDNSKSEKQIRFEKEINEEIESLKEKIEWNKTEIEYRTYMISLWKENGDKEMEKGDRNYIKYLKNENKQHRNRIAALKWVLE